VSELLDIIERAKQGTHKELRLIASANYATMAVRHAISGCATDVFAEGSADFRYVGGSPEYDWIEQTAIADAKTQLKGTYANVQPLSGALANAAVYRALLEPGDTVLALGLKEGGHLTHGSPFNFSGQDYSFAHYGLTEDGNIDYDQIADLAERHQPKLIVAGSSSYPRIIDPNAFRDIADTVNARLHFDAAHYIGFVLAGLYPNPLEAGFDTISFSTYKTIRGPRGAVIVANTDENIAKKLDASVFPGLQSGPNEASVMGIAVALEESRAPEFAEYMKTVQQNARITAEALQKRGYNILTNGTDTHIVLANLAASYAAELQGMTGADAEAEALAHGITLNKNYVPGDKRSAKKTSGFRLGLQAMTSRGLQPKRVNEVVQLLDEALCTPKSDISSHTSIAERVEDFCREHPVIL
jgi:glycine hydroxymethyltransferase